MVPRHSYNPVRRIGVLRFLIAALTCAALLGPAATAAVAVDVLIVRSGDQAPYRAAETALRGQLESERRSVTSASLEELSEKGWPAHMGSPPALVVAIGSPAAYWLCQHLPPTTKLAYCMVNDPQNLGLTERPETAGVSIDVPLADQLALIKSVLPRVRRVGMLYRADDTQSRQLVDQMYNSLPGGWQLEAVAVDDYDSVAAAINELLSRPVDVIWTSADAATFTPATIRSLLLTALRRRVPVFGFSPAFVRAGALMGISIRPEDQGRQVGDIARRLLDPSLSDEDAEAASHLPPHFGLAANLVVAEKLGLQLRGDLQQRAHYLIDTHGQERHK